MNTRTSAQRRSPKGSPAGGRFAADTKAEPETGLASPLYGGPDFSEMCECGHLKSVHPGSECSRCACEEVVDVEIADCPICLTNEMDARNEMCDECQDTGDDWAAQREAWQIAREIADESAAEYGQLGF